jgi:hypothetical protein
VVEARDEREAAAKAAEEFQISRELRFKIAVTKLADKNRPALWPGKGAAAQWSQWESGPPPIRRFFCTTTREENSNGHEALQLYEK